MVWKRGGHGGRVLAVGKMLVRMVGKGGKSNSVTPFYMYSCSEVVSELITGGIGSVQR